MWNKPQLMMAISELLFVVAGAMLFVAAVVWVARLPLFPLNEVVMTNSLQEVQKNDLEKALSGHLKGNFFSVNLEELRATLEQIPWARRVEVRRQWPGRLIVDMEEHMPMALWGGSAEFLVNSHGELFTATMNQRSKALMPILEGPDNLVQDIFAFYLEAKESLKAIDRAPHRLNISQRLAVKLLLDDGMIVELGRQQPKTQVKKRLERFVEYYPSVLAATRHTPKVVDMRYPNGFVVRTGNAPIN